MRSLKSRRLRKFPWRTFRQVYITILEVFLEPFLLNIVKYIFLIMLITLLYNIAILQRMPP